MCWNVFLFGMFAAWVLRVGWSVVRYLTGVFVLASTLIYRSGSRRQLDVSEQQGARATNALFGVLLAGSVLLGGVYLAFFGGTGSTSAVAFFLIGAAIGLYILVARGDFRLLPTLTLSAEPRQSPTNLQAFEIRVPRATEWYPETARYLIDQLTHSCPHITLTIRADCKSIRWYVCDSGQINSDLIPRIIRSVYPEAIVRRTADDVTFSVETQLRYCSFYRQAQVFLAPLKRVDAIKDVDPLAILAHALDTLAEGETVQIVLALGERAEQAYREGERIITDYTPPAFSWLSTQGVSHALEQLYIGGEVNAELTNQELRAFSEKLQSSMYYAAYFVVIRSTSWSQLYRLLGLTNGGIKNFQQPGFNVLLWEPRQIGDFAEHVSSRGIGLKDDIYPTIDLWHGGRTTNRPPTLILDTREIAALWHLPHRGFTASRIAWSKSFTATSAAVAETSTGTILGIGKYQSQPCYIRLPAPDRRTHQSIIGKSGTGKSTLMLNQISQDIEQGHGVAVIDPHGALVRSVLRMNLPEKRLKDIVVLDLADKNYPAPFNPLIGASSYAGMNQVINVIERLFKGTETAARMSSALRIALLTLQHETPATIRDAVLLLTDSVYREQVLTSIKDPEVLEFWDGYYNTLSPAMQRQVSAPILHRLRAFYANPHLYPVLCHPQAIDFRQLIEQRKIILISLEISDELVPLQERDLIGALLISRLQLSGMRGQAQFPFYIYIDEAQRFITTSLAEMLSGARKYNLSLIMANQYFGQLQGDTLRSVMGNVSTQIVFACSPEDARTIAPVVQPFVSAFDLMNLDKYHAVMKMQRDGISEPAFHVVTLPPPTETNNPSRQEAWIREHSRRHYTPLSRQEVLDWLSRRYNGQPMASSHRKTADDEATFYE